MGKKDHERRAGRRSRRNIEDEYEHDDEDDYLL
jgi:hypothetical protein